MRTKSCNYLQRALYLAPKEIRACCQRFFVNGEIRGDVVLIKYDGEKRISFDEVKSSKKELLALINSTEVSPCDGCPQLIHDEWESIEEEPIEIISIEDHSLCNMKCTYCSDVYYGGDKPSYDVKYLLDGVVNKSNNLHIAWGGGEPTIRKDFESTFTFINELFKPYTQRVFTNALRYSPALQDAIDGGVTSITTSIDAGSELIFRAIRGTPGLNKVLSNLTLYARNSPELITIKYIFTEENLVPNEVQGFVNNLVKFNLLKCNFLISTDFKESIISDEKLKVILMMFILLREKNIHAVTFDDHIYNRLRNLGAAIYKFKDNSKFSENGLEIALNQLFDVTEFHLQNEIIVWGTGEFAKYLLSTSENYKKGLLNIKGFVDGDDRKIGSIFFGHEIKDPSILLGTTETVVIASSNFYGEIANKLIKLGISPSRIAPNFII